MKKLMIAVTAMILAIGVNAAQWTWTISGASPMYDPVNGSSTLSSGTAYLFAYTSSTAAETALSSFVDDFAAGKLSTTGYNATQSISDGVLASNPSLDDPWSGMTKGDKVYWAMVVETKVGGDDYLFVDYLNAARLADGKLKTFAFNEADNSSNIDNAKDGYVGSGYYYVESVPEPFSGTLALIGLGAIALRRKMKKAKKA